MMRAWGLFAAGLILTITPAAAQKTGPVALTAENADRIRQAGGEILFWSQAQRDTNFPAMERQFPGTIAKASPRPYPLRPLAGNLEVRARCRL